MDMIRFIAPLLIALAASTASADVPLTRTAGGQLAAPVAIAGAMGVFVIDTGAKDCAVNLRFAGAHHLSLRGDAGVVAPRVEIDGQSLGDLSCKAMLADTDIDGVIGADALKRFVVTFDTRAMRLGLHGGAQHGQALVSPRARLIDARILPGALMTVPVRLNSAVGVAVLDTGAARSVFNARFAEAGGVRPMATRLGAFDLAGRVTPAIEGPVADPPMFKTLRLADRPAMILGLDRLAGLRLVIDYPRRRIWFDPG